MSQGRNAGPVRTGVPDCFGYAASQVRDPRADRNRQRLLQRRGQQYLRAAERVVVDTRRRRRVPVWPDTDRHKHEFEPAGSEDRVQVGLRVEVKPHSRGDRNQERDQSRGELHPHVAAREGLADEQSGNADADDHDGGAARAHDGAPRLQDRSSDEFQVPSGHPLRHRQDRAGHEPGRSGDGHDGLAAPGLCGHGDRRCDSHWQLHGVRQAQARPWDALGGSERCAEGLPRLH